MAQRTGRTRRRLRPRAVVCEEQLRRLPRRRADPLHRSRHLRPRPPGRDPRRAPARDRVSPGRPIAGQVVLCRSDRDVPDQRPGHGDACWRRSASIRPPRPSSSSRATSATRTGSGSGATARTNRLGGRDPYSASKACAELVAASLRSSYFHPDDHARHGIGVATARAGNVIGGGDWATDRLVPDVLDAHGRAEELVIRNPLAVRPWQFVLEPLDGYMTLAERLYRDGPAFSEAWNFGPGRGRRALRRGAREEARDPPEGGRPLSRGQGRGLARGNPAQARLLEGLGPARLAAANLRRRRAEADRRLAEPPALREGHASGVARPDPGLPVTCASCEP